MRQAKNCDSMTSTFMNYSTGRRFYETFTEIQEKDSFLRVTKFRTEIFDKYYNLVPNWIVVALNVVMF